MLTLIHTARFCLSFKLRGWALLYTSEGNIAVYQFGPFILEVETLPRGE